MIKVAIIANLLTFHASFNRDNIRVLKDMGCEIHLFSKSNFRFEQVDEFHDFCNKNEVVIHSIDMPRNPARLYSLFKSYFQMSKIFNELNFGLIHSHTPTGGLLGRLISKRYSIINIYTAHGFHFYKGAPLINWLVYYPIEKWLSLYTNSIITINYEDNDIVNKWKNVKSFYIPGVGFNYDKFFFRRENKEYKKINLLSVGELNKNKNHSFVIDALARLNDRFTYFIAGDGEFKRTLLDKIEQTHLQKEIKLLGFKNDLPDVYQNADIFIFPSKREGLSVSLMEAMASGLPVLASDIRGNRDLIDQGEGGYLFDLNDKEDFLVKLIELINNKILRDKMGRYNQDKAKIYDTKHVREKMKKIYSQHIIIISR